MTLDLQSFIAPLTLACLQAGAAIMEVKEGDFEVSSKSDNSPVTVADQRSEVIIRQVIAEHWKDIPVIGEEGVDEGQIPNIGDGPYFLVDPLDGTKEFVARRDSFTVNIGLIEGNYPVFGMVYAPAGGALYYAYQGGGAFKIDNPSSGAAPLPIHTADPNMDALRILASRSHLNERTEKWLQQFPNAEVRNMGSSLKTCLVAEGVADICPRLGPTMEWDTAAAQIIVEEAGGAFLNNDGERFSYRKQDFLNGPFLVKGAPAMDVQLP